jgi:hypothetical protein
VTAAPPAADLPPLLGLPVTLASLLAGVALAAHHPANAPFAVALWLAWVLVAWRLGCAWLFVLPALLPVASLAPWTGWVVFEEFDLLLLGALTGGYARAVRPARAVRQPSAAPITLDTPACLAMSALALLTLAGLVRGLADAGGPLFGWFHAQADAMNSLRVAKSTLVLLLMAPLAVRQIGHDPHGAFRLVAQGMVAGAALLCALVIRERAAFPGLLDWQLPYRTTAWFWDMHVGGAAIDAYLAITTPFVAWALWAARSWWRWLTAAALAVLWAYAGLTTYARGAYLGAAVSLLVLGLLLPLQGGRPWWRVARLGLVAAGIVVPLWLVIDWAGHGLALLLLACGVALWAAWRWRHQPGAGPIGPRGWAAGLLTLVLLFEAAAVVGPDSYMWSRVGISGRDGVGRIAHWQHGLALLRSPLDAAFGIGLGRLPAHYDREWPREQFSGRATWQPLAQGGGYLQLAGPRTLDRIGGLYGITQRVPVAGRYAVALDLRSAGPVELLVRVCESHLLYDRACQAAFSRIEPQPGPPTWRGLQFDLVGPPLTEGRAWAAREAVLTISVANAGGLADIDQVLLRDGDARPLLRNAGFEAGLAGWWPVAQFHFLPWHVDNLYLELLIERGAAGLLVMLGLLAAAWRAGRTARSASPDLQVARACVAASVAGGLCVGLVSSLMDVPRVAWLLGWMVLMLWSLREVRDLSPPLTSQAP